MAKKSSYIKQFFKDKKEVGAIAPSSKVLGRKMCSYVDFSKAKKIVELGPGNGVFTKLILERMAPDAKLLVFETNESFFEQIKREIQDDRMILLNDSAEDIKTKLEELGWDTADAILSSLPYTVFPKELKENIVANCVKSMDENSIYLQFQYSLNALKMFKNHFSKVKYSFSPVNVPPAFVYRCWK